MIIRWPRHVRLRCQDENCERCLSGMCYVTNLYICAVCGGAEGDLPTDCPGERVPHSLLMEVMAGRANYLRECGWVTEGDAQFRKNS